MAIAKIGAGFGKALAKAGKKAKGMGTKSLSKPKSIGKPINRINDKVVVGKAPKKTYASKNAMRADLDKNARSGFTGYTPKSTSKQNKYKQNMKSFLGSK